MNKAFFYLGITILFFSSYEVVSRTLTGLVNPFQVVFLRFLIGGILLLPFALSKFKDLGFNLSLKDFFYLFLLSLINIVFSMCLLQLGINQTKASLAAVIFSSNPIFVALSAYFLLKEPLTYKKVLGLVVGFSGLIFTFYKDLNIDYSYSYGILYLLLSALTYGIYTAFAQKINHKIDNLVMNSISFLIGSLLLVPILLTFHQPLFSVPKQAWPSILYIGIFVTGVAYYTYFKGLSLTNASRGSTIFFIKPILASFLAWLFLSEKITLQLILGGFITILGIFLVQKEGKSKLELSEKKAKTLFSGDKRWIS
ncbi:DMT family transporter [Thermodesulfobacterium sp.]|uniref:DMT family transporter n=1 Tax=Thermodesulfobacterium sp. TaxID=1965289 RepID=UPI00257D9732|nr:DMT family transporter [Thermodesulfobacterium sp.]MBZ4681949.1 hypothetical protein [Thermodesulfobacterium sp.]MDK2862122.1 hypothetical protein [Thermodesulfobacterium sp.]MDN5380478.1 hypothetical protein [Thermodesulfobacterium sp.]